MAATTTTSLEPWAQRAADKRDRINQAIPPEWKIQPQNEPSTDSVIGYPEKSALLSPEELAITGSTATALVEELGKGELKAVDVTLAFCKRAALAHQLVNCVLEFFPEGALAQARALDEYFEEHKKPVGPLHGLPISLKDQMRIKGLETSMGYISWLGKHETQDSILASLLRKAGAVFYVKTSVPQTLMTGETVNNIIGRTVNPRNKNWSCGGSSGGEGAVISMRGSVIGLGTDIGGSIRIPAAFNFLYGIRPSHGRVPYGGMANSMAGQETVHSVVGPLGHSASDLRLVLKSVMSGKPWEYDPKVVPLPWRSQEEEAIKSKLHSGGLTLGYLNSDGIVLPHPPILRGINEAVGVLKENGHQVVPWTPYKHDYANDLIGKIYTSDGCTDIFRDITASGEPAIPNLKDLLNVDTKKVDINTLWDVQLDKWNYQREYLQQWRELEEQLGREVDAIIAPVAPTAAVRHDQYRYYGYTSVVNLLDFTSVVVPVTFADKNIDGRRETYQPGNEMDALVQSEYDPEAYHGAPVAVQVIGRRLSEERTLAVAEEIGRLLGNSVAP